MGLETTMLRQWMGNQGPEDVTLIMREMMPLMMEKMGLDSISCLAPESGITLTGSGRHR